jgi:hypothetical protein
MNMLSARSAVAASQRVSQLTARRQLSSAAVKEPKMHKAKGNWSALKAKRPIDADDLHVSSNQYLPGIFIYDIPYSLISHPFFFGIF